MHEEHLITNIEELSLNAWPAHQSLLYDGWILRFANGYTKRANSVNPLYPSSLELDEKISFCEQMYREQRLDVVFKLTPASHPTNLDETLSARGYRKESSTSVQILDVESKEINLARGVELQESLSNEWLDAFCRMSAMDELRRDSLQRILRGILPGHCYASLTLDGQMIATGLGVLQAGTIGLYEIVVDEDFRSHGYGRMIVESILYWGRQNGAENSYLQVMLNNPPALRLYSKIGYVEKYQYWYRVKPSPGDAIKT